MSELQTFMNDQNLTTWLEAEAVKHGTTNQRERWAARLLPEEELCALAREQLFAPFANGTLKRWSKIRPRDLEHKGGCATSDISFRAVEARELRHHEWETYKEIQRVCAVANAHEWIKRSPPGHGFTLEPRFHLALCVRCAAELVLPTAIVRVTWAGRTLSREFSL